MKISAVVVSLVFTSLAACAHDAPNSPAASTPVTSAPSGPAKAACPAPIPTTQMCAAVMVWVSTNGACCAYGSPCEAPAGPRFSDDACTQKF